MKRYKTEMRLILTTLLLLVCSCLKAAPADRETTTVAQPDGTFLTLRLLGDEFNSWHITTDGYAVVQNASGHWVYAAMDNGRLTVTSSLAHNPEQRGLNDQKVLATVRPYIKPKMTDNAKMMLKQRSEWKPMQSLKKTSPLSRAIDFEANKFRGLVILVEFNDQEFSRPDYAEVLDSMLNQRNYTGYYSYTNPDTKVELTGSLRDYFNDSSAGMFDPQFDIVGPVKIDFSKTDPQKAENMQQIIKPAIRAAKQAVDTLNFANYDLDNDGFVDMVYFVFAGFGSNISGNDPKLLWPHSSAFWSYVEYDGVRMGKYACSVERYGKETNPNFLLYGIGCICHEFSHVLGLKDEYDTDYDVNGLVPHPNKWSIMAEGCYLNKTNTPCSYSLFERYMLGFAAPEKITEEGKYILDDIDESNHGYLIDSGEENVFFLLENRQKMGSKWNSYLPGGGMLAFRVDFTNDKVWANGTFNNNASHPYYLMLRANPKEPLTGNSTVYDSDGDPFPGSGGVTSLTNNTTPSLKTWAGVDCALELTDIVEEDRKISFNVRNAIPDGIYNPTVLHQGNLNRIYDLSGKQISPQSVGASGRTIVIKNGKKMVNSRNQQ